MPAEPGWRAARGRCLAHWHRRLLPRRRDRVLYAVRADVGAAASCYGSVPKATSDLEGVCPVVAGYGARDKVFGKQGDQLESHLNKLGVANDVVTYPQAGHSFMSDHHGVLAKLNSWGPMRVGFNPEAAEDSWRRVEAFFAEHLDGG